MKAWRNMNRITFFSNILDYPKRFLDVTCLRFLLCVFESFRAWGGDDGLWILWPDFKVWHHHVTCPDHHFTVLSIPSLTQRHLNLYTVNSGALSETNMIIISLRTQGSRMTSMYLFDLYTLCLLFLITFFCCHKVNISNKTRCWRPNSGIFLLSSKIL